MSMWIGAIGYQWLEGTGALLQGVEAHAFPAWSASMPRTTPEAPQSTCKP
jgi:hypothetical protein